MYVLLSKIKIRIKLSYIISLIKWIMSRGIAGVYSVLLKAAEK